MTQAPRLTGRRFWKMTGSGNDFVFFDNRRGDHTDLATPSTIDALCDRRDGVGADGLVLIDSHDSLAFFMRYYNRDGSLAEMCGNAALCSTTLAGELGVIGELGSSVVFDTVSGPVTGRLRPEGPEIDMVAISEPDRSLALTLEPSERCVGYVRVGVPHVVLVVDDVRTVEVERRGRQIRHDPRFAAGTNVNFVSKAEGDDFWRIRTFERGVERETLACGTGSVAVAYLLNSWSYAEGAVRLLTGSGRYVLAHPGTATAPPTLCGEGRVIFTGVLA